MLQHYVKIIIIIIQQYNCQVTKPREGSAETSGKVWWNTWMEYENFTYSYTLYINLMFRLQGNDSA